MSSRISRPTYTNRRRGFIVWGGILMLASIGAMLLGIARYHDLRAFDTAPACASSVPAATCRMTVSATIQEVKITTGKHSWYGVRISGPDDVSGTYRFPDDNALVETANIGDDVTAVMWHGDVVEIGDEFTTQAPLYGYRQYIAAAIGAFTMALVLFMVYAWDVRSVGAHSMVTSLTGWRSFVYMVMCVVALAAVVSTIVEFGSPGNPLRWVLPGTFVVVSVIVAGMYAVQARQHRRALKGRRSTVAPAAPASRGRIPGRRKRTDDDAIRSSTVPARIRKQRRWAAAVILVLGLGAGAGALAVAHSHIRNAALGRPLDAARPCVSGNALVGSCLTESAAEVTTRRIVSGGSAKQSMYAWSLSTGGVWIEFPSGGAGFVRSVPDNTQVTLTTWRGDVIAVSAGGRTAATRADPRTGLVNSALGTAILGAFALIVITLASWVAWSRPRRSRALTGSVALAVFSTGVVAVCLGLAWSLVPLALGLVLAFVPGPKPAPVRDLFRVDAA